MKRSLIAVTVLLSASALAMPLEQAQDEVNGAQLALKAERERGEQLKTEIGAAHQATVEGVGTKHASVMEQQQATFRGKTQAYSQCVARCGDLQQRLHAKVAEAGKFHTVVSNGDEFSVQAAPEPQKAGEPIIRRQAESAPYSNGGEYRLAR